MDKDKRPIPLHSYDQLLPPDATVLRRRALRRARRVHGLIARTLSDIEADPGIPADEATPEDIARSEEALGELAEALATYAAALERLDAFAQLLEQDDRDRRRASRFN